jgi:hypothetical protein
MRPGIRARAHAAAEHTRTCPIKSRNKTSLQVASIAWYVMSRYLLTKTERHVTGYRPVSISLHDNDIIVGARLAPGLPDSFGK